MSKIKLIIILLGIIYLNACNNKEQVINNTTKTVITKDSIGRILSIEKFKDSLKNGVCEYFMYVDKHCDSGLFRSSVIRLETIKIGTILKEITPYCEGKKNGVSKFYINNFLFETCEYKNGFINGNNYTYFPISTHKLRSYVQWYKDNTIYQIQYTDTNGNIQTERRGLYIEDSITNNTCKFKLIVGGPSIEKPLKIAYYLLRLPCEKYPFPKIYKVKLTSFDTILSFSNLNKGKYILKVALYDLIDTSMYYQFNKEIEIKYPLN